MTLEAHATALRDFATRQIAPFAEQIDREQRIPTQVVDALRDQGLFASGFAEKYGGLEGSDADPSGASIRHGQVHEALGTASASVQGLLNVHHMGGGALLRWGSRAQREEWGTAITSGQTLAAIAITEPNVGTNASAVETLAVPEGEGWRVTGTKAWITCGQSADVFVVLCGSEGGPLAVILTPDTPGLTIEPIEYVLGCRGYMMANLHLEGCYFPAERVLAKPGFGLSHVVAQGLDNGRHNLAWGCVGLAQACLDASLERASSRVQFGKTIGEFGQVQGLLARMMTSVHAARLVCRSAAVARAERASDAAKQTMMAKYLASTTANQVATDAIQVHGASGVGPGSVVERAFRDARITEIIEGTTQIVERTIARHGLREL